jgi:tRNA nucleotidyltransferase (CCA-adding enzyme)
MSSYITRLRLVRPLIGGGELIQMGFEPGPVFREILTRLLDARLDGKVKTRSDEVAFVKTNWSPKDK